MKKTSLKEIQHLFWDSLLNSDVSAEKLGLIISSGISDDTVADRMRIYSDGYFLRILNVLSEDFKDTKKLIGADLFSELVRGYLENNISNHYSLRYMGSRFPDFLKHHPSMKRIPWAAELARFEWVKTDIFDGPDHPVITSGDLAAISPEAWTGLKFKLIPSLTLLRTVYRVEALTESPGDQPAPKAIWKEKPETLKIWRKEEEVFYCATTPEELVMITLIRAGKDFSEICQTLCESEEAGDTAQNVFAILSRWIEDQILEKVY